MLRAGLFLWVWAVEDGGFKLCISPKAKAPGTEETRGLESSKPPKECHCPQEPGSRSQQVATGAITGLSLEESRGQVQRPAYSRRVDPWSLTGVPRQGAGSLESVSQPRWMASSCSGLTRGQRYEGVGGTKGVSCPVFPWNCQEASSRKDGEGREGRASRKQGGDAGLPGQNLLGSTPRPSGRPHRAARPKSSAWERSQSWRLAAPLESLTGTRQTRHRAQGHSRHSTKHTHTATSHLHTQLRATLCA